MTYFLLFSLFFFFIWHKFDSRKIKEELFNNRALVKKLQVVEEENITLKLEVKNNNKKLEELKEQNKLNEVELSKQKEKTETILTQKKSSESKLGVIVENVIPFIKELPYNSQYLRHLGHPTDFIYFNLYSADGPEIVIIEVKSGASRESKRQKLIKNAVRLGRVFYEEVRVDSTGVKVRRAKNE